MVSARPSDVLTREITDLLTITASLSDSDLTKSTGCAAWRVADLISHLRLGMEEILQGMVATTEAPIDRNAISYWGDWPPKEPAGFADVRWLWALTASYATSEGLRSHFDASARAALSAIAHPPNGRLCFQSHVMRVEDFLSMWVTEFAVHHFDLVRNLEGQPPPDDSVIRFLVDTLEALTGHARLQYWDDVTFLHKATGRDSLSADEQTDLGENVRHYPVFG